MTVGELNTLIDNTITNEVAPDGIDPVEVGNILKQIVAFAETKANPADKADKIMTVKPVSDTAYTIIASDLGKVLSFTNAAAITVTVAPGLGSGFNCTIEQAGAGIITLAGGVGVTINNRYTFTKSNGLNALIALFAKAANVFNSSGDMSI